MERSTGVDIEFCTQRPFGLPLRYTERRRVYSKVCNGLAKRA